MLDRLWVHDNAATLTAPRAGAMDALVGVGQDVPAGAAVYGRSLRVERNRYRAPASLAAPLHWRDRLMPRAEWRAAHPGDAQP